MAWPASWTCCTVLTATEAKAKANQIGPSIKLVHQSISSVWQECVLSALHAIQPSAAKGRAGGWVGWGESKLREQTRCQDVALVCLFEGISNLGWTQATCWKNNMAINYVD